MRSVNLRSNLASRACRSGLSVAVVLMAGSVLASAGTVPLQEWAGNPLSNMSMAELVRFEAGLAEFERTFTTADGLGPIFNQNSCAACHNAPVGGSGSTFVTRFGSFDDDGNYIDLPGGSVFQANTIDIANCTEEIPEDAYITAMRITTSTMGAGLIEAIPASAILANEDNPPAPWIHGRVHWVENLDGDGSLIIGRFGWKGQLGTNIDFTGDASLQEMGITNRIFPEGNAPNGNMAALEVCDPFFGLVDDQPDEITGLAFIDRVSDFQRYLAAPPQTPRSGMTGEVLFNQVGCNHCHVSTYVTADDPSLSPAFRNRVIKPYSDFLLHDMGLNADFIGQGDAQPTEMRTPPLWGVRLRDPLWHDGRVTGGTFADRMIQVIDLHRGFGSTASPSANAFFALSSAEQDAVIAFLDSLGRAEFDGVSNVTATGGKTVIDLADYEFFRGCFAIVDPITPDDACAIADLNQDGVVDLEDFAGFIQAYAVLNDVLDCNNNGVPDLQEILLDPSLDLNGDYELDNCDSGNENCQADIDGDGIVDANDMGILLGEFGCVSACTSDLNNDGTVNADDLAILLSSFGCESKKVVKNPWPDCGDPDAGGCCFAKSSPYCEDATCCETICAADPYCCSVEWDLACAEAALLACTVCDFAADCGSPNAGPCCVATGTPFCEDATCCAAICAIDPYCCDTAWDSLCAEAAIEICGVCSDVLGCGSPASGACCEAKSTPFCEDPSCCSTICLLDPFCCEVMWDDICAEAANGYCGVCN
jgi:CxxC motif-containing protein (DUF1111 family)